MTGVVTTLWFESMAMTAVLIAAVLLLRRPVAALFGARTAYSLWLVPLLRLVLPPLPGGVTVIEVDPIAAAAADETGTSALGMVGDPSPAGTDMLINALPLIWLAGFVAVLGLTLWLHRTWVRATLAEATPLEPIGRVRLMMSAHVDGPVATGLIRPLIAVPTDFFARYNRAERALAIEHELAHHRAGDLWANAAALLVLAAQWFNPFAWWALSAFRFDQEAACDARILGAVAAPERPAQAHHYARAIAKSLAGPRLVLAAPMTSGTKVKERLHMLTHNPRLGVRPAMGRLLLGGATIGALALTASTLPARVVFAAEPEAPVAPVPPSVADAPSPPGAPVVEKQRERHILFIDANGDSSTAASGHKDGEGGKRSVHRIVVHSDAKDDEKSRVMMFDGDDGAKVDVKLAPLMRLAMPFHGPSSDELRATLKEQGIDDAKADAIIKSLDKKRAEARAQSRLAMVPLIAGDHGYPMTEGTYRKLRQLAVPSVNEKEMLERTLSAMTAARENYARKVGERSADNPAILESLDREIEHLKDKIKRM